MRIAITGSSGFVGTAAATDLAAAGHEVVRLVRTATPPAGTARWDPATGAIDERALGAVDAVLHLAGANIAAGRWTEARKRTIADSRAPVIERLCRSLAALARRPSVLIGASGIGIYGDRGDEWLDERSTPGDGFLANVARAGEAATQAAADAGIRVVPMRFGIVLDPSGGALRRMLRPFRLGVAGRLGNGRQWMSWITLADMLRAIRFVLDHQDLRGPVLAVAPEPVTNREFTRTLAAALHRPAILPVPAAALRLLFGELADAALLASQRARPAKLLDAGFEFRHPDLRGALAAMFA